VANTLLPLNSIGVFQKTYHLALLTSGERALTSNTDVGG
jgi:hypothetical protein